MLIFIRVSNNSQKFCKESVNQIKRSQAFFSESVFCKQSGPDIGKWFVILKLKWPPAYVTPKRLYNIFVLCNMISSNTSVSMEWPLLIRP